MQCHTRRTAPQAPHTTLIWLCVCDTLSTTRSSRTYMRHVGPKRPKGSEESPKGPKGAAPRGRAEGPRRQTETGKGTIGRLPTCRHKKYQHVCGDWTVSTARPHGPPPLPQLGCRRRRDIHRLRPVPLLPIHVEAPLFSNRIKKVARVI